MNINYYTFLIITFIVGLQAVVVMGYYIRKQKLTAHKLTSKEKIIFSSSFLLLFLWFFLGLLVIKI